MATDELECLVVDEKKRRWLIAAGAFFIIPNYLDLNDRGAQLLPALL